jgi:hypothetical protein
MILWNVDGEVDDGGRPRTVERVRRSAMRYHGCGEVGGGGWPMRAEGHRQRMENTFEVGHHESLGGCDSDENSIN